MHRTWIWNSRNDLLSFNNWASGQPINAHGRQHCPIYMYCDLDLAMK